MRKAIRMLVLFYLNLKKWLIDGVKRLDGELGLVTLVFLIILALKPTISTMKDPPEKPEKTSRELEREVWARNETELSVNCINLFYAEPYYSETNLDLGGKEVLFDFWRITQEIDGEMNLNFHGILREITPIYGEDFLRQLTFESDTLVNVFYSLRGEVGQTYSHLNLPDQVGNEFEINARLTTEEGGMFFGSILAIREKLTITNPNCIHISKYKQKGVD